MITTATTAASSRPEMMSDSWKASTTTASAELRQMRIWKPGRSKGPSYVALISVDATETWRGHRWGSGERYVHRLSCCV